MQKVYATINGDYEDFEEKFANGDYCLIKREGIEELSINSQRKKRIKAVNDCILEFGKELGLDLSERSFLTQHVHYLSPEIFDELFKTELEPKPENDFKIIRAGGFNRYTLCIAIKETNEADILESTSHEFLHAYSVDFIRAYDSKILAEGLGYDIYPDGRLHLFNEGIVSYINAYLVHNNWSLKPELEFYSLKLKYKGFSYDSMVCFNQLLISDLALKFNENPVDLRKKFFRNHFTTEGYMESISLLTKAYGIEDTKRIFYLKRDEEEIYRLIGDLGLAHHSLESV